MSGILWFARAWGDARLESFAFGKEGPGRHVLHREVRVRAAIIGE